MLNGRVRDALILLVTVAWLVSVVASAVSPSYTPDPSINGAFGLVVGAVLAAGKKDEEKDAPDPGADENPKRGRR